MEGGGWGCWLRPAWSCCDLPRTLRQQQHPRGQTTLSPGLLLNNYYYIIFITLLLLLALPPSLVPS